MESPGLPSLSQFSRLTRRLAQRALAMGSNRAELAVVELQEAGVRLLQAVMVAVGLAIFGLLTGIALTATLVVVFWHHSPLLTLVVLTLLYAAAGLLLYFKFIRLMEDWQILPATVDQLRKDCECLDENLN
jgi:uncharacterized membrane protein YqjE